MMRTLFLRVSEAPPGERGKALREAIAMPASQVAGAFNVPLGDLTLIPRSPFVYWIGNGVRSVFSKFPRLDAGPRVAKQGLATADDFRFVRLWTEVGEGSRSSTWRPFAKGGSFSPYYSNIYLVVKWERDGLEIASNLNERGEVRSNIWMLRDTAKSCFFREGITWPRRPHLLGSFQYLPQGCVFGSDGPAVFSADVAALAAILNSAPYLGLLGLLMARGTTGGQTLKYEVGYVTSVPVPTIDWELRETLAELAKRSWRLQRSLDTRLELSRAFVLPALLQVDVGSLSLCDRAQFWGRHSAATQAELYAVYGRINEESYQLYEMSGEDRSSIERGFGTSGEPEGSPDDEGDEADQDEDVAEVDATPMVASLLSWALGVAFGRFDVRLATGEREVPPEPEPFDPLPVCSPGMLTGDDGLPVTAPPSSYPLLFPADGILVDDAGHPRDVVRAVRSVFETVFDDANARWHEASELLGGPDLRARFARDFFEPHIKRYSKSRRKAPIYWQLATASGSYSVWLYIHRATNDTLYRVLNDFVGPKLDHERSKLDRLTQEYGQAPSSAQRKEIADQEEFVNELQAFKLEVARVAPLWKPNLDDGVILNYALLWRLVPQSRSWQIECKSAWDKLQSGAYDWAHIAMHLWPERVVPKCADDRSLAIAHGLEDMFWRQDEGGTWRKNKLDDETLAALIHERSSTTVKSALRDLLSAPTPAGGKAKPRSTTKRSAVSPPKTASTRTPKSDIPVDENTLQTIKNAIATFPEGASKADVLSATDLSDGEWNKAIATLLERGEVERSGQGRGTRYGVLTGVE